MKGIYLLLGSNLGDRLQNLHNAIDGLNQYKVSINRKSAVYESEPWGKSNQPWFLNMVLDIQFDKKPTDLLDICLKVEEEMGRVRQEKWMERIIDIDILFFEDQISKSETLQIPHPGIQDRRFTLLPLNDLASNEVHPVLHRTTQELLDLCEDPLEVRISDLTFA